jgi:hypothetical protein
MDLEEVDDAEDLPAGGRRVAPATGRHAHPAWWLARLVTHLTAGLVVALNLPFTVAVLLDRAPPELAAAYANVSDPATWPAWVPGVVYAEPVVYAVLLGGPLIGGTVCLVRAVRDYTLVKSRQRVRLETDRGSRVVPIEVLERRGSFMIVSDGKAES